MEPVYKIALEEIKANEEQIEELLNTWRTTSSRGIRIVDNIRNDYHIPVPVMKDILIELHDNRLKPIHEIESKIYLLKCYALGLRGPIITMTNIPDLLGCAKSIEYFKASLKTQRKTLSDKQIDRLVNKLYSTSLPSLTSEEEQITVSAYPCWSSWGTKKSQNPFHFLPPKPGIVQVLANFGLSHSQLSHDHLLFLYSKTAVTEIRIPTIADAALYSYFKCSAANEQCGWTQPWNPEDYERYGIQDKDVLPRPEGVHLSVKLKDLIRPLQLVKGLQKTTGV